MKNIVLLEGKIGDGIFCNLIMGQSPPGDSYNKEKNGLPFYQGKADFGLTNPNPTVWCTNPKRIAIPNDILLSVRAPVGPTNIANEKCSIGRGLAIIRPTEKLDFEYLLYILRKFELEIASSGSGSTFDSIGKDELKAFKFPVPALKTDQLRIASEIKEKLSSVEQMRQAALKQKEAVEAMQGALLREVFPYKPGDELPEGWRWERLQRLAEIVNGSTPSTDESTFWNGNILWATPTDVGKLDSIFLSDTQRKITHEGFNSCSTKLIPPNNILMTSRAPVGNLAINTKTLCTNQGFKSFILKEDVDTLYLFFYLKHIVPLIEKDSHGNTFTEITKGQIEKMEVVIPKSKSEQKQIGLKILNRLTPIEQSQKSAFQQLEAIEALPAAILREFFEFKS